MIIGLGIADVFVLLIALGSLAGSLGSGEGKQGTPGRGAGREGAGHGDGDGKFAAKYVTYTDGLFGKGVRGNVS
ncbi:hypothetical protein [Streptomyces sp. NPDC008121]|uniref:hypothetical protein n=1 Tax=Streptomyces sp. NPDC008121 TaxID=3364809 RepID=UPI0036DFEA5D